MTTITIPNRPAGSDVRHIADILADFDAITNVVNGSLDNSNLAQSCQQLIPINRNTNVTILNGELAVATVNPLTLTLPPPALGAHCGVFAKAATGANPITIVPTGSLSGGDVSPYVLGLAGGYMIFKADATQWYVVGGRRDSGWIQLTNATNVVGTLYCREINDMVYLTGVVVNSTGGNLGSTSLIATLPAGTAPWSAPMKFGSFSPANGLVEVQVTGSSPTIAQVGQTGTWLNGQQLSLNNLNYPLRMT